MSKTQQTSLPAEGAFDSVTICAPRGSVTTLTEELPYRIDGFDWQFVTTKTPRVRGSLGHEARGVIDGETVTRGRVNEIIVDPTGLAEVLVAPP